MRARREITIRADQIQRGDWLPTGIGSNKVQVASASREVTRGNVLIRLAQDYGHREYRPREAVVVYREEK